jgi:hypothetical protein
VTDSVSAARRACLECGRREFIADSEDHWDDDAEAEYCCACPCGEEEFAAAVGYSLREDGDVHWVFVGLRCLACDMLGTYEDWKINWARATICSIAPDAPWRPRRRLSAGGAVRPARGGGAAWQVGRASRCGRGTLRRRPVRGRPLRWTCPRSRWR